jgi:RimJ/RimL family protein N-acetyltransferase
MVIAGQKAYSELSGTEQLRMHMGDGQLHLARFEYSAGGIILRENTASDAPYLKRWFNDHENVKWMDDAGKAYTEKSMKRDIKCPGLWTLDMTVVKDGNPIGYCSIYNIDNKKRDAELSLLIGEKGMQRRGYGNDIVKGMREIGFDILELKRLKALVSNENERSIRAFKKNDFSPAIVFENEVYLELTRQ